MTHIIAATRKVVGCSTHKPWSVRIVLLDNMGFLIVFGRGDDPFGSCPP